MRFIDYNGSGRLDPQDIATSVAVESAKREDDERDAKEDRHLESNAGCMGTAALMILPILTIPLL